MTDIEILRLHCAGRLRHWRPHFAASRHATAALYDERFHCMFDFYLTSSKVALRREGRMMFLIQFAYCQTAVSPIGDYRTGPERQPLDAPAQRGSVDTQ